MGYVVEYRSGRREIYGEAPAAFTVSVCDARQFQRILTANSYSVALDFIRGRFDIRGDLLAALRWRERRFHRGVLDWLWSLGGRLAPVRLETWFQSRDRAARNIRFHYDVSNEFYRQFLDARMVYSSGLFEEPRWSLEQAQEARLERICKDLELRPGERFLDVGCGWGSLLVHAAERFAVQAMGCTLSHQQYEFTTSLLRARSLERTASVKEVDYRELSRRFDKVSSIGMFEHVGRHRLLRYFAKIYGLLEDGGLFLNSGITRPETVSDDAETWFLLRRVFPGGELAHLSEVVRAAESVGFRILRIVSQRNDYARTCEEWVSRLRRNRDRCVGLVGEEIYRTWLLYLAASAVNFDSGQTDDFSILMRKG